MKITDIKKRDVRLKDVYLKDGKLYDEETEIDIMELIEKLYEPETPFTIAISAKTESDVDLDDVE